jgi:hypothetical protein
MSPLIDTRRRDLLVSLLALTAAAIMASSVSSPPSSEHRAADVAKIQRAVSVCVNFVRQKSTGAPVNSTPTTTRPLVGCCGLAPRRPRFSLTNAWLIRACRCVENQPRRAYPSLSTVSL